jgi:hypothetical protein
MDVHHTKNVSIGIDPYPYMVTFTINMPPMLPYIYMPYMEHMGYD